MVQLKAGNSNITEVNGAGRNETSESKETMKSVLLEM